MTNLTCINFKVTLEGDSSTPINMFRRGQIRGKTWIKERRRILNADASVHQGQLDGLVRMRVKMKMLGSAQSPDLNPV